MILFIGNSTVFIERNLREGSEGLGSFEAMPLLSLQKIATKVQFTFGRACAGIVFQSNKVRISSILIINRMNPIILYSLPYFLLDQKVAKNQGFILFF